MHENIKKSHYQLALIAYFISILISPYFPDISWTMLTALIIISSIEFIKKIIIFMIIVGIIVFIFPILSPLALIAGIFFFFSRLAFIIENIKAVIYGVVVYAYGYGTIKYFGSYKMSYLLFENKLLTSFIVGFLGLILFTVLVHILLNDGYSLTMALGIMGMAPILIASLLLPFIKIAFGGFGGTDHYSKPDNFKYTNDNVKAIPFEKPKSIETKTNTSTNGNLVEVKSYQRTAPDGIKQNNLSYDGPDKQPSNLDKVQVKAHVRTAPDGIKENNLSNN